MKKALGTLLLLVVLAVIIILISMMTPSSPSSRPGRTPNPDPSSPFATYVSPRLGITFTYAKIDPLPDVTTKTVIIENEDTISTSAGGSITVFSKDPTLSLVQAIQQRVPNCKVISTSVSNEPLDEHVSIYLPDLSEGNTLVSPRDVIGDPILSPKDEQCIKEAVYNPLYFAGTSKFPDRYIGVLASTQAVEAVLSIQGDHVTWWMSTVDFVQKK